MTVRIAAATLTLQVGDLAGNRAAAQHAIQEATAAGVDLLVLPELTPTGYAFADRTEAYGLAEPVDGLSLSGWAEASGRHEMVIVGGFAERSDDGLIYNSAALLADGAVQAVYRKAHLWDREQLFFTPGSTPPPVVSTRVGRVGMLICYDLEFPEWVRRAGLAGADILAAPTSWPYSPRPVGERPLGVVKVQADAATNHMFVVAADRRGPERGVDWVQGSVIVGPDGFPLAGPQPEDPPLLLIADIDPTTARDKLIGPANDIVADRRTDLYPPD